MRPYYWTGMILAGLAWAQATNGQTPLPGRQLFGNGAAPVPQSNGESQPFRGSNEPTQARRESLPPVQAESHPRITASADAPLMLAQSSWTYTPPPPIRKIQINDIVTIRVDELASVRAEGASESRKNSLYDAFLEDWIGLDNGRLVPAAQRDGEPGVSGTLNARYRADAALESRESLTLNVAARVVDIRPNGHLVLEAHKTIWVNENAWETSLSGVCRPQDIGPDNVLLSRDIIDLQINKQERGRLRDGYRRGWFQRIFEELQPF